MAFNSVSAAAWNSVLAEHYRIAGNIKGELPKHTHEQYQIGISFTDTRTYLYRRGVYPVRPGSLSVIFPGEVHGGGGLPIRDHDTDVFTLYIPAEVVQDQEEQYTDLVSRMPPFVDPVINDSKIAADLVGIHGMIIAGAANLQAETLWQNTLRKVFRFPSPSYSGRPESASGVRLVREYLDAHATERITLTELSRPLKAYSISPLAGISCQSWHLAPSLPNAATC